MLMCCVYAFSLRRESPIWSRETNASFQRWFCHSHLHRLPARLDLVFALSSSAKPSKTSVSLAFSTCQHGSPLTSPGLPIVRPPSPKLVPDPRRWPSSRLHHLHTSQDKQTQRLLFPRSLSNNWLVHKWNIPNLIPLSPHFKYKPPTPKHVNYSSHRLNQGTLH